MLRMFLFAVFFCLSSLCLAAATPPGCSSAEVAKPDEEPVFLQDSGSTNTAPFCYTVSHSGEVIKRSGTTPLQRKQGKANPPDEQESIPASLATKLFSDVEAAMPLSGLPVAHCVKSASFGTSRYVWFKGERSPDLCGRDNEKVSALKDDFAKVMSTAAFEHQQSRE